MPPTLFVILGLAALFPWLVLLSLSLRMLYRRPRVRLIVFPAIGIGLIGLHAWADLCADHPDLWPLAVALCIAGFNALHFASVRLYARVDLR